MNLDDLVVEKNHIYFFVLDGYSRFHFHLEHIEEIRNIAMLVEGRHDVDHWFDKWPRQINPSYVYSVDHKALWINLLETAGYVIVEEVV